MSTMERMQAVRAKVNELIGQANEQFGIELPPIDVRFDLRGRAAGMAGRKGNVYFMRFNRDMLTNSGWDHLINDTVPHELAHIVCFFKPSLGRNHDAGWKSVCRRLGGTGERCHSEEVVYAKGRTYRYKTTQGHVISVSERIHKKIQLGHTYTVRRKGGLNRECEYELYRANTEPKLTSTPTNAPRSAPKAAVSVGSVHSGSNASRVRAAIHRAKTEGFLRESVIDWAVEALNMSRSLARTYVNNNWDRVSA